MRQLLDYYYVLMVWEHDDKTLMYVQNMISYFGMKKFAGGIMYVMHKVFGLPTSQLVVAMNEKEGKFLLAEIRQGGNFGQYDTRLGSKENESKFHRYLRMNLRNFRFVKHYPTEALSEPLFRT